MGLRFAHPNEKTIELLIKSAKKPGQLESLMKATNVLKSVGKSTFAVILKSDGLFLESMQPGDITYECCHVAVDHNGLALKYVPEKFVTEELCDSAIINDPLSIKYVPEKFLTDAICRDVVLKNGLAIEFIPQQFLSDKLYELACFENGNAMQFVKEEFLTFNLCASTLQRHPRSIKYFPVEIVFELFSNTSHQGLIKRTLEHNGAALDFIPDELITEEMMFYACREMPSAIKYVPERLLTTQFCIYTLKAMGDKVSLEGIPYKIIKELDYYFIFYCLSKNGDSIKYIPEELRNIDFCKAAYQSTKGIFKYIPSDLQDLMGKAKKKVKKSHKK